MQKRTFKLWSVIFITAFCLFVAFPRIHLKFETPPILKFAPLKVDKVIGGYDLDFTVLGFRLRRDLSIPKGLDLQGGLQVTLQADVSGVEEARRKEALEAAREIISRRVNLFGIKEPAIYTLKTNNDYRIVVEMPGVTNPEEILKLVGQTARLDIREQDPKAQELKFKKTNLAGEDLKQARVSFDPGTGEPVVVLEFTKEGAQKSKEITQRNIGKLIGFFLDDQPLRIATVKSVIEEEGVITGGFAAQEAKTLAIQLSAGALPLPVTILGQKDIGPSLEEDSIKGIFKAGAIGLMLVAFFMIGFYGKLGLLADFGLAMYGLMTLALYKLVPVPLTLAGLAGSLLSVGMAVDSNILISEKIREEIKSGKPRKIAMRLGFRRAWNVGKEANICALLVCFVLFNPLKWSFLNTAGVVGGFALTLSLGIFISLFTGILITKTLIERLYE